jgi:hypothetical protein
VTIAKRPSCGTGWREETTDFGKTEAIYFSRGDWTGIRAPCPTGKSLDAHERESGCGTATFLFLPHLPIGQLPG